jgi:hypothetical protein
MTRYDDAIAAFGLAERAACESADRDAQVNAICSQAMVLFFWQEAAAEAQEQRKMITHWNHACTAIHHVHLFHTNRSPATGSPIRDTGCIPNCYVQPIERTYGNRVYSRRDVASATGASRCKISLALTIPTAIETVIVIR